MRAVILAAGRGERMRPLTDNVPKPLVRMPFDSAQGKPLIDYTFAALPDSVTEVILVVGYRGEQIKKYCGTRFAGRDILYVEQKEPRGTFHALKLAAAYLDNEFLVMLSDDIYAKQDIEKLSTRQNAILVKQIESGSERFGHCIEKDGLLCGLVEKQPGIPRPLACCGPFKLTKKIFNEPVIYGSSGEEVLSPMVGAMSKRVPVNVVHASFWHPIATPEDLALGAEGL